MTARKTKRPAAKRSPRAPAARASAAAAKAAAAKPGAEQQARWLDRPSPLGARAVARLRRLCLALPETTERLSHGEVTWFVRGKTTFVMMSDHHHDDRVAFTCAGADGAQEVLVATQPRKFFRPPYVGHRGWLGVYLDVPEVDWDEIADLVVESYRQVAPQKLVDRLGD